MPNPSHAEPWGPNNSRSGSTTKFGAQSEQALFKNAMFRKSMHLVSAGWTTIIGSMIRSTGEQDLQMVGKDVSSDFELLFTAVFYWLEDFYRKS